MEMIKLTYEAMNKTERVEFVGWLLREHGADVSAAMSIAGPAAVGLEKTKAGAVSSGSGSDSPATRRHRGFRGWWAREVKSINTRGVKAGRVGGDWVRRVRDLDVGAVVVFGTKNKVTGETRYMLARKVDDDDIVAGLPKFGPGGEDFYEDGDAHLYFFDGMESLCVSKEWSHIEAKLRSVMPELFRPDGESDESEEKEDIGF